MKFYSYKKEDCGEKGFGHAEKVSAMPKMREGGHKRSA